MNFDKFFWTQVVNANYESSIWICTRSKRINRPHFKMFGLEIEDNLDIL